jgi:hypothetical protein
MHAFKYCYDAGLLHNLLELFIRRGQGVDGSVPHIDVSAMFSRHHPGAFASLQAKQQATMRRKLRRQVFLPAQILPQPQIADVRPGPDSGLVQIAPCQINLHRLVRAIEQSDGM